jgi:hypothetical protein
VERRQTSRKPLAGAVAPLPSHRHPPQLCQMKCPYPARSRALSRANRVAFPSAVNSDRFRLAREDRREWLVLANYSPPFVSRARHTPGGGSVETRCVRSHPCRLAVRHKRSGPKRETPERLLTRSNPTVLQRRVLLRQRESARPLPRCQGWGRSAPQKETPYPVALALARRAARSSASRIQTVYG